MTDRDVAIIGAGPYGLAAAAYLTQIKGLGVSVFGEPMSFWRTAMPKGMLLRSAWSASNIADPKSELTLDAYKIVSGNHLCAPVALQRFVDYGLWYQQSAVPNLDRRFVCRIDPQNSAFRLTLSDGTTLTSKRVVVACGTSAFAARPNVFDGVPPSLAAHTSQPHDFTAFAHKYVAVIGGGQSALESAALLHEAGAKVEIFVRRSSIHWLGWKDRLRPFKPLFSLLYSPTDVGPAGVSRLVANPVLLKQLPRVVQDRMRVISTRPAGAHWLVQRLQNVLVTTQTLVTRAVPVGDRLKLTLNDQSTRIVDYILLGTGYRVDVQRYSFVSSAIVEQLSLSGGYPQLGRAFESSVPGLHFLGAPAAWSYGPLMNFVSGTKFAAANLARHFSATAKILA
jgi:cation diffusion facilitator CzcD-associated flavoprotein CzcO